MIPEALVEAAASPVGGKIALVLGAGCSMEVPPGLKSGRQYAREAHAALLESGLLAPGDCATPGDLAAVADAVISKVRRQRELTETLPSTDFASAMPNDGYLLAAAMLREHAIADIITLNFDLALAKAVELLGLGDGIQVLEAPEDYPSLGTVNIIYLHRNVHADPEQWVLSSAALNEAWRQSSAVVLAHRVVSAPHTVFAGLGSSASVLQETAKWIAERVNGGVAFYQVDMGDYDAQGFRPVEGLLSDRYMGDGWVAFMKELSRPLARSHCGLLANAAAEAAPDYGLALDGLKELLDRLVDDGLLQIGKLRARWTLADAQYVPYKDEQHDRLIATFLLATVLIEQVSGGEALFASDGTVEFWKGEVMLGAIAPVSAFGQHWPRLEIEVLKRATPWGWVGPRVCCFLTAHGEGAFPESWSPLAITGTTRTRGDIIGGDLTPRFVPFDEILNDPSLITEVFTL